MADTRLQKLAQVLVNDSLGVEKGMWVRIDGAIEAAPPLTAACVEVLKAGGFPMVRPSLPGLGYLTMKHASDKQLSFISPTTRLETDAQDAEMAQAEYEDFVYGAGKPILKNGKWLG
jgi:aminopeptidase